MYFMYNTSYGEERERESETQNKYKRQLKNKGSWDKYKQGKVASFNSNYYYV